MALAGMLCPYEMSPRALIGCGARSCPPVVHASPLPCLPRCGSHVVCWGGSKGAHL